MQRDQKYSDFNTWISANDQRLKKYYTNSIGHVAIDQSRALDNVADAIRHGDALAMDIGFDLLAHDPVMPFGKIVKSKLLSALRLFPGKINERKWHILLALHEKWESMKPFPPREFRYLEKLLKKRRANDDANPTAGA